MRLRSRVHSGSFLGALVFMLFLLAAVAVRAGTKDIPDFAREIKPLFEQHCVQCHGPEKQKGGVRFDTREGAFNTAESGEKPFLPGHSSQSRLIKLIGSKDKAERMPPKGEPLSKSDIVLIKR